MIAVIEADGAAIVVVAQVSISKAQPSAFNQLTAYSRVKWKCSLLPNQTGRDWRSAWPPRGWRNICCLIS
jgi:hypothetical protein